MTIMMPAADEAVLQRKDGIVAALRQIVSGEGVISSAAEMLPYESDGLTAYRALMPQAAQRLKPGGLMALEIGAGQGAAVRALAANAGLSDLGGALDLTGIERCLLFSR